MKFILPLVFLSALLLQESTSTKSYEQVVFDHFAEEMLSEYDNLDVVVFTGDVEETSSYSAATCISVTSKIKSTEKYQPPVIEVQPIHSKIKRRLGLCNKLFKSKNKIGFLYLYEPYESENEIIVALMLDMNFTGYIFGYRIDKKSKKIIDVCKDYFEV